VGVGVVVGGKVGFGSHPQSTAQSHRRAEFNGVVQYGPNLAYSSPKKHAGAGVPLLTRTVQAHTGKHERETEKWSAGEKEQPATEQPHLMIAWA
jgi:hypothetical protein